MKNFLLVLCALVLMSQEAYGQTIDSYGKPIAEIFTDFHINFNDTTKHTGFALNRAYLGYQFLPEGNLSAKIIVNIGSPEDLAEGSEPRRYAYCREASLEWSNDRLTIAMGITGTRIFAFQQTFWGKRYIANTYQSINGYGFVADLGIAADYIINDIIKADVTIMNGEGYSDLQLDDNVRTSLGFTITPIKEIAIRVYGDIQRQKGLWQPVAIGFLGFKNDFLYVGGEISYKSNIDLVEGHHAWGVSATGGFSPIEKMEIFGRYDYSSSVVVNNEFDKWNYLQDGSFAIVGIQYTFSPNVKLALDYQGSYPYAPQNNPTDLIYLNAFFKF